MTELVVAALVSFLISVLASEFLGWCPWLVKRLIAWSVARLPFDEQDRYDKEWFAEFEKLLEDRGKLGILWWALNLYGRAGSTAHALRKAAERPHPYFSFANPWIGIDVRAAVAPGPNSDAIYGIGTYTRRLLEALAEIDQTTRYVLFSGALRYPACSWLRAFVARHVNFTAEHVRLPNKVLNGLSNGYSFERAEGYIRSAPAISLDELPISEAERS